MTQQYLDVEQGSEEWKRLRVGSLGASRLQEAIARTKTGWGASRANLMAELVCERLTGNPSDCFTNAAMKWGNDFEAEAREAYEFWADVDVETCGLFHHPHIEGTHASPDGLVGDDGMLEIKCPTSATHIDTLMGRTVPAKYATQMMWQLACSGRKWCDFVSYDPRMPESMRLFVRRLERNDETIAELEAAVGAFLSELDKKVMELRLLYDRPAVAA